MTVLCKKKKIIHQFRQKICTFKSHQDITTDERSSILDVIRQHVPIFSGNGNAQQWFSKIDSQFSESNVSFQNRLDIIPYLLTCDAMIWFSLTKDKFKCYTDFCRLFVMKYFTLEQPSSYNTNELENLPSQLNSSTTVTKNISDTAPVYLTNGAAPVNRHSNPPQDLNSNNISTSVLSSTISKALIDKFVKDP